MAIIATDLLVVNRGGVDYKAPVSELQLAEFDSSTLEALIKANADAIAELKTDVESIEVGEGWITILKSDKTTIGEFNVNQDSGTEITLPRIGEGWVTINAADGDFVAEFNVNQDRNTEITLPQVVIPEALHPKGFINVADAAPADPVHGDIYIQHQDDQSSAVAAASFTGLSGRTIEEGTFVLFGVDDEWHAGGNANSTQVQSDWSETDQTSPAFILSKPDVYTKTESDAKYLPLNISLLPALPAPFPSGPWDVAEAIYHVKINNSDDINVANQDKIYNLASKAEVSSIDAAGEWVITGKDTRFKDSAGNWEFGAGTDISNVTNMAHLFRNCSAFNADVSNWDVSNVTHTYCMFERCAVFNQNLSGWKTGNNIDMSNMFYEATVFNQNLTSWCVDQEWLQNYDFDTRSAMPKDLSHEPLWGTCPGGK